MDQFLHHLSPFRLCATCRTALLHTLSVSRSPRYGLQNSPRIQQRHCYSRKEITAASDSQASPIEGYYKLILESSLSSTHEHSHPPPPESEPSSDSPLAVKARITFGSRLAGPSRLPKTKPYQVIAGVSIPPRPAEPDNCCMSGCVHCVWDIYRDEMEEWAAARAEARRRLAENERKKGTVLIGAIEGTPVAMSMDDDGGGRESNWGNGELEQEEDLFGNIPVGIREFMRTEKRLKERQRMAGSAGG